jgi:glycosyltransferase involved in cell wall biosynthesis
VRVLLNVSVLRGFRTGIGHYTLALAQALAALPNIELVFFDGLSLREDLTRMGTPQRGRQLGAIKSVLPMAYQLRRCVMQHRFYRACRRSRPDIYHEPSLWPLKSDVASVMTLHDLTHVHYPETQPRRRLEEIDRHCAIGLERAGSVLVDSEFIGREVVDHFGLSRKKIVVAPLGVSAHFKPRPRDQVEPCLKKLGLRYGKFILAVGTLEPRKNLSFTLKAHLRLPEAVRREYPLVVVGMEGWHHRQFSSELKSGLEEGRVKVMGYLEDNTVALMSCGARMLVYPSIYEGFGLPVVEAMASGLPVIASNRASIPEVAGSAAVYVELNDVQAYAQAMARLIENEEIWQQLKERGLARASQFTWQRCAEKTLSAYQQALGRMLR